MRAVFARRAFDTTLDCVATVAFFASAPDPPPSPGKSSPSVERQAAWFARGALNTTLDSVATVAVSASAPDSSPSPDKSSSCKCHQNGGHVTIILLNTDRTELAVSLELNYGGVPVMRLALGFPVAAEVRVMAQTRIR